MQKVYKWNSLKQPNNISIPDSLLISPPPQTKETKIIDNQSDQSHHNNLQSTLTKKYQKFMENNQFKNISKIFYSQRGKNHPINYQKKFNFKQQWEFSDKTDYKLQYNYLFPQKTIFQIFNVILLILQIILIWILSIFRFFENSQNKWIFIYSLICQFLDIVAKLLFIWYFKNIETIKFQHKKISTQKIVHIFAGNLYCLIYSFLGICQVISDVNCKELFILDILGIFFYYFRCQQIYRNVKKKKFISCKFKSYINIFDLMSNLFIIVHIFAVLIFIVSSLSQNSITYLTQIKHMLPQIWIQKYLYSIYFSTTTMLTVGYGDITPANYPQIIIVLIMQVFGIVTIGYINGEVGDILCKLRTQRQAFQHDLESLSKISISYNLSHQVRQKIQDYLVTNKKINQKSIVQQQSNLLSKVNTQLKQQANHLNQINIIKRSLFFILNFSKKTQIEISYKLQKLILPPDESLPQIIGKQKLYIVKQGQIALFISRRSKNWGKKVISTISKKQNQQLNKNIYGEVSTILGRPTRLKAFSKILSTVYILSRAQLIQCIKRDKKDFQNFHSIRAKLEEIEYPEKKQNSKFYNHNQHYSPNIISLLKRQKGENICQVRKHYNRSQNRGKLHWESLNDQNFLTSVNSAQFSSQSSIQSEYNGLTQSDVGNVLTQRQRNQKYKSLEKNNNLISNIKSRSYQKKIMNKTYIKRKQELIQGWGSNKLKNQAFQCLGQFQYFFKHSNYQNILKKINFKHLNTLIIHYANTLQTEALFNNFNDKFDQKNKIIRNKKFLRSTIV